MTEKPEKGTLWVVLVKNLCQKRSWQIGAGGFLVLMVIVFCWFKIANLKEKISEPLQLDQKRSIFTGERIQKTIARTTYQADEKKSFQKSIKPKKRKYATDIAVFVFKAKEVRGSNPAEKKTRKNKLGLPAGTKISAYLSGTLFSFNVEAPVTAIVLKDVKRKGKILIPKDSQFLGEAGVLKSLNRINVRFDLLILPDGREKRVQAMALSEDGSAGIKGKVDKHRDMKALKAIGETLLAGASLFSGTRGASENAFSLQDQLRLNLSQNLTQQARQDLRDVKVETSITAETFMPIQIILLDGI